MCFSLFYQILVHFVMRLIFIVNIQRYTQKSHIRLFLLHVINGSNFQKSGNHFEWTFVWPANKIRPKKNTLTIINFLTKKKNKFCIVCFNIITGRYFFICSLRKGKKFRCSILGSQILKISPSNLRKTVKYFG